MCIILTVDLFAQRGYLTDGIGQYLLYFNVGQMQICLSIGFQILILIVIKHKNSIVQLDIIAYVYEKLWFTKYM